MTHLRAGIFQMVFISIILACKGGSTEPPKNSHNQACSAFKLCIISQSGKRYAIDCGTLMTYRLKQLPGEHIPQISWKKMTPW